MFYFLEGLVFSCISVARVSVYLSVHWKADSVWGEGCHYLLQLYLVHVRSSGHSEKEGHKASEKHRSTESRSHHKHSDRSSNEKLHDRTVSDNRHGEKSSNSNVVRSSTDKHSERHGEKSERLHKTKKSSVGVQCKRDPPQSDLTPATVHTAPGNVVFSVLGGVGTFRVRYLTGCTLSIF
jgi:hypothetical protein